MKCTAIHQGKQIVPADLSAVFIFHEKDSSSSSVKEVLRQFEIGHKEETLTKDITGKEGESVVVYTGIKKSPRLLVVGLGDRSAFSLEKLRRASAAAAKKARSVKANTLALYLGTMTGVVDASAVTIGTAIAEGIQLSLYKFGKYLTSPLNGAAVKTVHLIAGRDSNLSALRSGFEKGLLVASATIHARDLANAPGNEIYPETLAADARKTGKKYGFSVTVLDRKKLEKLKMGGVLTVNSGSDKEPRFIIMEHGRKYKNRGTVVLVGKGVTFDSGGISIKPAASMAEMKMDMSGAAAVIGTFQAAAQLKIKRHIVGLIPAVENMLSGSAVKPGDIIRHHNGKTSEVDNTDAEGRLILADALSYASKYKPDLVIDLATLTGAVVVALGHHATGMMGNDQKAMDALRNAGDKTYERVWQLPMFDEYEKQIKSDIADVKNVGGRWAGAITAGFFLKKFIGDYPWVHLDIAGTAILEADQEYIPKGGSGVGVRLLIEFLEQWKKK
jgi:leucyl aminopeptidase